MTSLLRGVYIVGAKRTPFGTMGGKLKDHTPTQMAVVACKAALESAGVKPENVDVCVAAKDTPYCSRHVALHCGLPQKTPSLNVNRLCGSGFQAAVNGVQEILLGNAEIALTFGSENMSLSPFILRNARFGVKFGMQPELAPSRKRLRLGDFQNIDAAVLTWFKDVRAQNVRVSGPMLQEKTRQFATIHEVTGFEASSGWLDRFRQ
ncbi:hypothetical protein HPB50_021635 [Hyalomma asiaticum]|uniref:Uncharacterized protein n=1 Tax=Hyalomma asiaticum TaxID=266040 RepID=A0ACB7T6A0_HYAAI|nr:hypothetical protein HPB50_021635 [Hyalomma asiaticum]